MKRIALFIIMLPLALYLAREARQHQKIEMRMRQQKKNSFSIGSRCLKCKKVGIHLRGCPVGIALRPRK